MMRRPADLTEEILRIYGYNNIEVPARAVRPLRWRSARSGADSEQNGGDDGERFFGDSEQTPTKLAYYEGLTSIRPMAA
ncbi:MAG: hypothetical protein ACLUZZ_00245 [Alistipes inops]